MNKSYMVEEDGKINVVTDTGEIIERTDKYTQNTDEILSLENAEESLERKIKILKTRLSQLKTTDYIIKYIMSIIAIVFIPLPVIICLMTQQPYQLPISLLRTIIVITAIEIPLKLGLIKNKKKIKEVNQRIIEIPCKINKMQKRINILFQDKTPKERNKSNNFIEVKSFYNYNFDASDYFIEKYLIDKRVKEMSHGKSKTRKRTKTKTNITYEIQN